MRLIDYDRLEEYAVKYQDRNPCNQLTRADFKLIDRFLFECTEIENGTSEMNDILHEENGWSIEKRTSGGHPTDLRCPCGGRVMQDTVSFRSGSFANRLYCRECGLSMRSPMMDKGGEWLKKFWKENIIKNAARLMTMSDIWDRGDDESLFIDYMLPDGSTILKPAIFQPENSDNGNGDGYMCFVSSWYASGFYNIREYGKTWRCWTSRPTDEQREGIPWQE